MLFRSDTQFQMNVVDIMAKTESLLVAYRREHERYQDAVRQLEELEALAAKSRQDEDYLRFQVEEVPDRPKLIAIVKVTSVLRTPRD